MKDVRKFLETYRTLLAVMVGAVVVIVVCLSLTSWLSARDADAAQVAQGAESQTIDVTPSMERRATPAVNETLANRQALVERVRANWRDATGEQPDLSRYPDISVDVSLKDQMVYVKSAGKVIYEMVASTGINDTTPHGTFRTNGQGGDHFYTPRDHMGGDYWTRITGVYLFHSVPTNEEAGDYIVSEAVKLGEPASHGCVRLTVADAKWVHEQLPKGTPVTIE
ncbi:L,D-transpeptidase [Bifidobacterium avesanii]|nr:L,D-transpeptidase [Bifidobacterium avesanii]KAB8292792.1 peptidase [Bifidobacterium avesanii]